MPEGAGPAAAQIGARPSRDFAMAAFADLDLRAGSDLKALRGLVENAAHCESPRLRGPRCLPSLSVPPDCQATLGRDPGGPRSRLMGSPGCPWKLRPLRCRSDSGRGKLESTGELLPSLAPYFLRIEETEALTGRGICIGPHS